MGGRVGLVRGVLGVCERGSELRLRCLRGDCLDLTECQDSVAFIRASWRGATERGERVCDGGKVQLRNSAAKDRKGILSSTP